MKAIVYTQGEGLSLENRPDPGPPLPGHVSLGIEFVGVCGTDFHIVHGTHPAEPKQVIPGHEVSAIVLEVGKGVEGFDVGMPVIVNPYLNCGECVLCQRGRTNCCTSLEVIGVHTDGALCERILIPAKNVYSAQGLNTKAAAVVEVLAVGVHAVRTAGLIKDATVLVIGAGPVGLCIALLLRDAGFDFILVDISEERVAMAKERFGFKNVIRADGSKLNASDVKGGVDYILDATGCSASVQHAFNNLLTYGGTLVSVGIMNDNASINLANGHKYEKSYLFTRNSTAEDFETALESAEKLGNELAEMVTHVTDFKHACDDILRLADNKTGLLKAVVQIR